jgi:hypothetical protein
MNRVGAGDAKMHRSTGGYQYAMRYKQVLLRDHADSYGAIRILFGAEIIFDELPGKMERQRIDSGAFKKPQYRHIQLIVPGRRNQGENQRR